MGRRLKQGRGPSRAGRVVAQTARGPSEGVCGARSGLPACRRGGAPSQPSRPERRLAVNAQPFGVCSCVPQAGFCGHAMLRSRTGGARRSRPHVRLSGCVCVKWLDGCTELVATAAAVAGGRQDQEGHRGCEGCPARASRHRRSALCAPMRPVHPRLSTRATDCPECESALGL